MPREWHPLRLFVHEDGRQHPTILFWLFLVPLMAIVVAGCYAVLNRRAEQARVAAALTRTPTPVAVRTSTPPASSTPRPPTGEPTATEYVYDDPSGWELVERTDPTGKKYMDLQDWQREQVWHAFEDFWDLVNHNQHGLPRWDVIVPHIAGSFAEYVRGDYDHAVQTGSYIYFVERVQDIPHRALILESHEAGNVSVKVVLQMERSYQLQHRALDTGEVVEQDKWLPYRVWSFIMSFQGGRWVIQQESHELFTE